MFVYLLRNFQPYYTKTQTDLCFIFTSRFTVGASLIFIIHFRHSLNFLSTDLICNNNKLYPTFHHIYRNKMYTVLSETVLLLVFFYCVILQTLKPTANGPYNQRGLDLQPKRIRPEEFNQVPNCMEKCLAVRVYFKPSLDGRLLPNFLP